MEKSSNKEAKQAIKLYSQLTTEMFYGFNMKHVLTELFTSEPGTASIIKDFVDRCRDQRDKIYDKKTS